MKDDMSVAGQTQQTILLDADDTLWENNIYFERAIAAFISLPRPCGSTLLKQVRRAPRRHVERRDHRGYLRLWHCKSFRRSHS